MSLLSNFQKAKIAMAAREAYDAWDGREAYELVNQDHSATDRFEAWRHVETGKAAGVQSLRQCTQAHYGRILAHFQELAGNVATATRTRGRDADNDRRIARYKLNQALRERSLLESYAAVICRGKFKCELNQASAAQLWKIFYDVRKRRKPAAKPVGEVPW